MSPPGSIEVGQAERWLRLRQWGQSLSPALAGIIGARRAEQGSRHRDREPLSKAERVSEDWRAPPPHASATRATNSSHDKSVAPRSADGSLVRLVVQALDAGPVRPPNSSVARDEVVCRVGQDRAQEGTALR
jgi:hypothetical protein